MLTIDRKKVINVILGTALASSLFGLVACDNPNEETKILDDSMALSTFFETRHYNYTALFFDGDAAILIPCNFFSAKADGFLEIDLGNCEKIVFSSSDVTIFSDHKDQDSYDQALNFALAISSCVYNYEDVLNGNYNNIALGYKVQSEMGISK